MSEQHDHWEGRTGLRYDLPPTNAVVRADGWVLKTGLGAMGLGSMWVSIQPGDEDRYADVPFDPEAIDGFGLTAVYYEQQRETGRVIREAEERGLTVRRDLAGHYFQLLTTDGGHDPEGKGGFVHPELGGSGCRWAPYEPSEVGPS